VVTKVAVEQVEDQLAVELPLEEKALEDHQREEEWEGLLMGEAWGGLQMEEVLWRTVWGDLQKEGPSERGEAQEDLQKVVLSREKV